MPFLKDDDAVRVARLSLPETYEHIAEDKGAVSEMAACYNRIGGLFDFLAGRLDLDPLVVLALWYIEVGGAKPRPGRPPIRIAEP